MSTSFWLQDSDSYTNLEHTSLESLVYPEILQIINQIKPKTLLDYGSGDGKILHQLNSNIELSIFDISYEMLVKANTELKNKVKNTFKNYRNIPKSYYDICILSMVLVCINDEEEYTKILQRIFDYLKPAGSIIIAVTHPCFRQYDFSDFYTEYSRTKPFNYFNESEKFKVTISDSVNKVIFDDYHWSLSFTINKIIEAGFTISSVTETRDDKYSNKFNRNFSPFLIITARK